MSPSLASWLFALLSRLPLPLLHRLGVVAGWMAYWLSNRYAERLYGNLQHAWKGNTGAEFQQVLRANVGEAGKGVLELPWVWRRPVAQVAASVKACHGWDLVEAARSQGKGLILLTPHIGCFEVIGKYLCSRIPITTMYRVPKQAWLDKIMREGRECGQLKMVHADIGGVRSLFKTLKRGEVIGVLPDQVPGNGEGEWVSFFGRPAYTMTLVNRLWESSGAAVLMCYAERLPQGKGYVIRFLPLQFAEGASLTQAINATVENIVMSCPAQYLWSYNRYKTPSGASAPDSQ